MNQSAGASPYQSGRLTAEVNGRREVVIRLHAVALVSVRLGCAHLMRFFWPNFGSGRKRGFGPGKHAVCLCLSVWRLAGWLG
jgi:hypothetical protein